MKKIMTFALASMLAHSSCKKENGLTLKDAVNYSDCNFQSEATSAYAAKGNKPSSNMKMALRQVVNKTNTYRLVVKIDSVLIPECKADVMLPLSESATLFAGLSIVDSENPKNNVLVFQNNTMEFKKQNENGFNVYVSEAFVSDLNFDYELVELSYTIKDKKLGEQTCGQTNHFLIANTATFFVLQNGKSIEQNPELVKVTKQGKWQHANGKEYIKSMVITIANDPAQTIKKLIFKPDLIKITTNDPNEPVKYIQLPSVEFDKTHFNPNTGVTRFSSDRWGDTYSGETTPWEWSSSGIILGGPGTGAFTPIFSMDLEPSRLK